MHATMAEYLGLKPGNVRQRSSQERVPQHIDVKLFEAAYAHDTVQVCVQMSFNPPSKPPSSPVYYPPKSPPSRSLTVAQVMLESAGAGKEVLRVEARTPGQQGMQGDEGWRGTLKRFIMLRYTSVKTNGTENPFVHVSAGENPKQHGWKTCQ